MKRKVYGELERYRVVSGDIDKVFVAKSPLDACVKAIHNSPDATVDSYFFTVYCNWGYSQGCELKETINTDKVLKRAGYSYE